MGFLGGFEWLIIVFVVLFFFGAKRIPGLARGIGQGIKEFRNARIDPGEDKEFRELE
ncbi:MAG: twin-arginine translocase TatA/TatE family subunit [Balneolaceae bacterium]